MAQMKANDRPRYPAGVPGKFSSDGTLQHWAGDTIICHIPPSSPVYHSIEAVIEELSSCKTSSIIAPLPATSLHMTIFEGVSDQVRRPGYWPSDLALDATQEICNEHFEKKLRKFTLGPEATAPYRVVVKGIDILDVGVAVRLDGITPAEVERLRALRDRLADELKIRHPIHDEYGFHISMVYFLRHPNDEQKQDMESILKRHFEKMAKEVELGPPEFCLFANMHAFDPVFYLS
ncbi:hypothetical protein GCG54_00010941 [Colletotrichum gloeosporioides]|uniref:DUF1868 domain-containing protein n=1 Tax=Colletotrichum gloeosporioides TaxID=474922 RepID=A0A8H4CRG1_COLGL|nr:uncharacterized protein GCG54_00010941 [Colletotrichum gloeosporioides]KAF3808751.1 hypothetical protein GCG54_00010941 [Colletotrichum gloeosporioides]